MQGFDQPHRRKREAREAHKSSAIAQKAFGIKAKLLHAKRHAEKVQLKKTLKAHDERNVKQKDAGPSTKDALPTYLLDRETQKDAKALSTAIKEKRKDKAAKYAVPLPKVRGIAEDEMFKVMKTGKSKSKAWKRMVTKATFVGEGFTRKPVKMERFIRPMALRYKKANVTHRKCFLISPWIVLSIVVFSILLADLKATFQLQILGVKKNPQSPMYTQLGVLTKGTVIEVNVSELGMVTAGGKVVFGKYAQVTNNPENDGCINAVLCEFLSSISRNRCLKLLLKWYDRISTLSLLGVCSIAFLDKYYCMSFSCTLVNFCMIIALSSTIFLPVNCSAWKFISWLSGF